MKLHRLRMQAFGPFGGIEEVDFDALAHSGLHLIHGPTGAGKTSILDAICFALFSAVPGGRMQGRETLHSHHAAPTLRPEVELEFSVGDRRLRVCRSPEHQVPKKRGSGTRPQRGSVHLQELRAGTWTALSTRSDEVAQMVGDLLGMGLAQFAQVMLLPQGEFTAFLRAKPDDRGKLLERLFDISDFAAVEDWLADHRKDLQARAVQSRAQRDALVARARDVLGAIPPIGQDDDPPAPPPELDDTTTADDLDSMAERFSDQLTVLMAASDAAETRLEALRTQLSEERTLQALQSQGHKAHQVLERLEQEASVVADAGAAVERAKRAQLCEPAVLALHRRQAAHEVAHRAGLEAHSALATATDWPVPEPHDGEPLTDTALRALQERAAAGSTALAGQPELRRQIDQLQTELVAARTAHRNADADRTKCATVVTQLAGQIATMTADRDRHAPVAAADSQWRDLLHTLDTTMHALDDARTELADARQLHDEHRAAQQEWTVAEQHVVHVRSARLSGIAAELADGLAPDLPCPVCGSVEHPRPARPGDDHVDAEQVAAAEELASSRLAAAEAAGARSGAAAGRAHTVCRRAVASLRALAAPPESRPEAPGTTATGTEVAAVTAADSEATAAGTEATKTTEADTAAVAAARESVRSVITPHLADLTQIERALCDDDRATPLPGTAGLDAVVQSLRDIQASTAKEAAHAATATEQLQLVQGQLEMLRTQHVDAEQTAADAAQVAATAQTRVEAIQTRLDAAHARCEEIIREHATACGCREDPDDGHPASVEQLQALVAAAAAERGAAAKLASARAELDDQLHQHGFDTATEVADSVLDDSARRRLQAMIDAATQDAAKATGVLEQSDVAAAMSAAPADVEGLAARTADAQKHAHRAHDAATHVQRSLQTLQRISHDLRARDEHDAPLHERLAVATSVASAVNGSGDNEMRMRLTAYVLAARLETVTALANQHLHVMTGARFQLEHTDQRAARGRRSGLGLRVRDAWTGTTRDTATLSGGEAFIASLALALGLGEAVLQSAGGRRLETLLVDEGFGSLDEDSLEQVLDVLDGLRAGGRTVGIVSHVAELRTRIPSQIRVRKTTGGSTLQVITAGAA